MALFAENLVQKLNASGYSEILTCSQFLVTAADGYMNLSASGDNSGIDIQASSVNINTGGAYLQVLNSESGGAIVHSASGDSACISLETPTETVGSNILVTPKGIALTFGLPETLATVGLTNTGLTLSVGPPETGSLIQMTPDSILLKVGGTEFALTAEGIVSKAPLVETTCDETKVTVGPDGVSEAVAEAKRSISAQGHSLGAAEVTMNISVAGISSSSPTSSAEIDAASSVSAATLSQTAEATTTQEAPVITAG